MADKATNGNGAVKGLSSDFINELMAGAKTRAYGPKLLEFMESDEAGCNPRDNWPLEFGDKTATALMQSFKNAAKKAGIEEQLTFIKRENDVFIIHNERAAVATATS
jgi:hypothetical protein